MRRLAAAVFLLSLERLAEAAYSRRNEGVLRSRGAIERGSTPLYAAMVALNVLWLVSTFIEGVLGRQSSLRHRSFFLAPFLLGQSLRLWSMWSLKTRWTIKVLVVPGSARVRSGPYRYIRHPNYLGALLEFASFPLLFGARLTALAFSVLGLAFFTLKAGEEERALSEFGEP